MTERFPNEDRGDRFSSYQIHIITVYSSHQTKNPAKWRGSSTAGFPSWLGFRLLHGRSEDVGGETHHTHDQVSDGPTTESHVRDDVNQNEDSGDEDCHEEITPEGNGVERDVARVPSNEQSDTRKKQSQNEEPSCDFVSMFNHCVTFISVVGVML